MNGQRSDVTSSAADGWICRYTNGRMTWRVPESTSDPAVPSTTRSAAVTSSAYPHLHTHSDKKQGAAPLPPHPT